jgi:hypothetical protein
MPEAPIHRYDVTFEATEIEKGRSIVTFSLSRDGQPADQSTVFFFEPNETMNSVATHLLAQFLNKYIARFGIVLPDAEPEET